MTEIMSTMTVLVKSIKSTCRVKYATEKDHPRGASLILLVSRGSWVFLRQESSRKGEVARTQKPFVATLRVNESRPAELGQQPETSLAWWRGDPPCEA